mgnify:FL=1
MMHQLQMPICTRCGKVHTHFLEYAYSALCQECHDRWIVETFSMSFAALKMTNDAAISFLHQRRPELFDRGVMPDYFLALKSQT